MQQNQDKWTYCVFCQTAKCSYSYIQDQEYLGFCCEIGTWGPNMITLNARKEAATEFWEDNGMGSDTHTLWTGGTAVFADDTHNLDSLVISNDPDMNYGRGPYYPARLNVLRSKLQLIHRNRVIKQENAHLSHSLSN